MQAFSAAEYAVIWTLLYGTSSAIPYKQSSRSVLQRQCLNLMRLRRFVTYFCSMSWYKSISHIQKLMDRGDASCIDRRHHSGRESNPRPSYPNIFYSSIGISVFCLAAWCLMANRSLPWAKITPTSKWTLIKSYLFNYLLVCTANFYQHCGNISQCLSY